MLEAVSAAVGYYLLVGLLIQRFAGRRPCGGEGFCLDEQRNPIQGPHPGVNSYHGTWSLRRRVGMIIGWIPWLGWCIGRYGFQSLGWTVGHIPVFVRGIPGAVGRVVGWVIQGAQGTT